MGKLGLSKLFFRKCLYSQSSVVRRFHRLSESLDGRYGPNEMDGELIEPHIMTEEEIMLKYWKILVRKVIFCGFADFECFYYTDIHNILTFKISIIWLILQTSITLTSQAFQRWMCLTAGAVTFWTSVLICRWLTTDPTLSGILSFIFPLLIIPLLASVYAEVNYESGQVLQVCNGPGQQSNPLFWREGVEIILYRKFPELTRLKLFTEYNAED